MQREKLNLNDTAFDVIRKMSEGNPGATTVLIALMEKGLDGILTALDLDDMNIRGSALWIAYKDYCRSNLQVLIDAASSREPDMVRYINDQIDLGVCGDTPRAITHGAS